MEKPKQAKEPFPGAYYVGAAITFALLLAVVVVGSSAEPGLAGFVVAFGLGLTVNPQYSPYFYLAGVFSLLFGFAGGEPQVAWGGVGLVLSQAAVSLMAQRWTHTESRKP